MMKLLRLLMGSAIASLAVPASAACVLTAATTTPSVLVTYDPFSPAQTVLDLNVRVTNSGDVGCQAKLFIRPSDGRLALSSAGGALTFRLDGQSAGTGGQAGEIGPFLVEVPAAQGADIAVRATLTPQQVVPRGLYGNDVTLRVEDGAGRQVALAGGAVRLQANTLARTEMSVSGATLNNLSAASLAPASINFGTARPGQTERVFVNVWSNGSVAVTLDSENDGVLRLVSNPQLPPIAYSARFDGGSVLLTSPVTLVRSPPMSLAGASYELALTLPDISHNFAGQYRDVITITVNQN